MTFTAPPSTTVPDYIIILCISRSLFSVREQTARTASAFPGYVKNWHGPGRMAAKTVFGPEEI